MRIQFRTNQTTNQAQEVSSRAYQESSKKVGVALYLRDRVKFHVDGADATKVTVIGGGGGEMDCTTG